MWWHNLQFNMTVFVVKQIILFMHEKFSGDESLTEVRHFMTDSELHPVNEYHSYTDSYGATSSAPYSNQPSTSQNV